MLDIKSLLIIVFIWAVTTIPAVYVWDATLGQRLLHLKVMHMHREHPGLTCAILRQIVFFPISLLSVIGLLMAFVGSRRCWHDHMSGCKVATHI